MPLVASRIRRCCLWVGTSATLLLCVHPAAASPILQEVYYDAIGPDASTAFTEIYGAGGLSLDGWSLRGINGGTGAVYRTIDLTGAVIPSSGLLVVASSSAAPTLAAVRGFIGNVDWQNGPDAIQLLNPLATVVDALQYGNAGAFNSGEGTPALDAPAGSSLTRDSTGSDTNVNLVDFAVGIPSPGAGPDPRPAQPVPEPGTLLLLGSGLVLLAVRVRRVRARGRLDCPHAREMRHGRI